MYLFILINIKLTNSFCTELIVWHFIEPNLSDKVKTEKLQNKDRHLLKRETTINFRTFTHTKREFLNCFPALYVQK